LRTECRRAQSDSIDLDYIETVQDEAHLGSDARCAVLAATQYGLITLAQAIAAGLNRQAINRRVTSGRWIRIARGVYQIAGAPRSWHQRALGVILALEGAAACGPTAAALHRMDGFALTRDIHVVARTRYKARPGVVPHFTNRLIAADVMTVGGIPVTSPARTIVDLAGFVGPKGLEEAFEDVLRRRLTTKAQIQIELLRHPRNRSGIGHLRDILSLHSDAVPTESALETKVIQLLRDAGYPNPVRQRVINDDGAFVGRVDLAWPERRLVLEVESFRWHSGSVAWHRDVDRRNELLAAGLTVVQATHGSLRRPKQFLRAFGRVWRSLN
jgi:hypothetical protein